MIRPSAKLGKIHHTTGKTLFLGKRPRGLCQTSVGRDNEVHMLLQGKLLPLRDMQTWRGGDRLCNPWQDCRPAWQHLVTVKRPFLYRSVLRDFISAMLGCFSLTPSVLPLPILKSVLDIISGIFKGCWSLKNIFLALDWIDLSAKVLQSLDRGDISKALPLKSSLFIVAAFDSAIGTVHVSWRWTSQKWWGFAAAISTKSFQFRILQCNVLQYGSLLLVRIQGLAAASPPSCIGTCWQAKCCRWWGTVRRVLGQGCWGRTPAPIPRGGSWSLPSLFHPHVTAAVQPGVCRSSVMSALRYLDTIPYLTCKHNLQDKSLKQVSDSGAEAVQALPVQPTGLFIPKVPTESYLNHTCLATEVNAFELVIPVVASNTCMQQWHVWAPKSIVKQGLATQTYPEGEPTLHRVVDSQMWIPWGFLAMTKKKIGYQWLTTNWAAGSPGQGSSTATSSSEQRIWI